MPQSLQLQKIERAKGRPLIYDGWSKEQLITEITRLRKRKKYGLVWEPKDEDVVEQCKKELPVLKDVASKAIQHDKNASTNILIEGDNYHALSVLNYTHKGRLMLFTLIRRITQERGIGSTTITMWMKMMDTGIANGFQ